jgi:hypothetical protein
LAFSRLGANEKSFNSVSIAATDHPNVLNAIHFAFAEANLHRFSGQGQASAA